MRIYWSWGKVLVDCLFVSGRDDKTTGPLRRYSTSAGNYFIPQVCRRWRRINSWLCSRGRDENRGLTVIALFAFMRERPERQQCLKLVPAGRNGRKRAGCPPGAPAS